MELALQVELRLANGLALKQGDYPQLSWWTQYNQRVPKSEKKLRKALELMKQNQDFKK